MENQNENLRERLLAHMPQPENLAAYREETAALLARHARALRWDKIAATTLSLIAVALVFVWGHGPYRAGTFALHYIQAFTGVMFFVGVIYRMRYEIYDSQVATLKEVKQVQLQILELQASIAKIGEKQA